MASMQTITRRLARKKTSGIQLLFKSGERQVYDMLLSAFCDGKGDFIF